MSREAQVLDRIRAIPEGYVATYGDISPGSPRFAGSVLAACDLDDVPWQRVVRADGSLAKWKRQRRLLVAEGVPFRGERVVLSVAQLPREELDQLVGGPRPRLARAEAVAARRPSRSSGRVYMSSSPAFRGHTSRGRSQ